jgi:peptide-methionine (S)-S-oxide reductase
LLDKSVYNLNQTLFFTNLLKKMRNILIFGILLAISLSSCAQTEKSKSKKVNQEKISMEGKNVATFGAGCFWCVEAVFQRLNGVEKVESGYAGGKVANPSYKDVCTGLTGHAEVCNITYDPKKVSFEELLEVFWKTHDPTTLNRQGNDVGTQYRSSIFYHNAEQKAAAEKYKKELDASGAFDRPIVTSVEPYTEFYEAEDYHQNYFNQNGYQPYCQFVVKPKVEKFEKVFKGKLKKEI